MENETCEKLRLLISVINKNRREVVKLIHKDVEEMKDYSYNFGRLGGIDICLSLVMDLYLKEARNNER